MEIGATLRRLWTETTGFDYVDRLVVTFYLMFTMMAAIVALGEILTPEEVAELASVFDLLGYGFLFFFAWPVLRLLLTESGRYALEWWQSRGETA